ncbi:cell envelope integrity EipB family protein [Acetobacteraceae bacterium KSS8]|uniref:Cell envelope integrity EipB family protein n=1 Tax=Endosaccharibacter trunci TaxID=2812733 RepID=A0ABT1W318_9PROT|nr:cell envelope integrity EipB family protein [Acetobacteraceae bacterium KSS8]
MPLSPRTGPCPALSLYVLLALVAVPAVAMPASTPADMARDVHLAPHTARYELSLASTSDGNTVAATGDMNFKVTDSCQNWATQQQLRLQIATREGQSSNLVSTYATLESKDGRHLSFDMEERDNGQLTQQVRGEASLDADGKGRVRFTLPTPATLALPAGTLFPMMHTAAIIRAAEEGKRSIDPLLFDGTSADGPSDSYVTILGWHPPPTDSDQPSLRKLGSGRVHVAFFSRKPGTMTPDYEVGMRYFANGVSDRLRMNFGSFVMNGAMVSFTPGLPAAHCRS